MEINHLIALFMIPLFSASVLAAVDKPEFILREDGNITKIDYDNDALDVYYYYNEDGVVISAQSNYILSKMDYDSSGRISTETTYVDGYVLPVKYSYEEDNYAFIETPLSSVVYENDGGEISTQIWVGDNTPIDYARGVVPKMGGVAEPLVDPNDPSLVYEGDVLVEDSTYTYEYNSDGQVSKRISKESGYVLEYSYYDTGELMRIKYPDLKWEDHFYNAFGRLTKIHYYSMGLDENISLTRLYLTIPGLTDTIVTEEDLKGLDLQTYEMEVCGNGVWESEADEECDDGNTDEDDFCTSDCKLTGKGLTGPTGPDVPGPDGPVEGAGQNPLIWIIIGFVALIIVILIYSRKEEIEDRIDELR